MGVTGDETTEDRNRDNVFGIDTFVDQDDFCRAVRRCNRRDNVAGESSDE